MTEESRPEELLDFCFPGNGHRESRERHGAFWDERMQGSMDAAFRDRFGPLTEAAAKGLLDHSAESPRGRLALPSSPSTGFRVRSGPACPRPKGRTSRSPGARKAIATGLIDACARREAASFSITISDCGEATILNAST